MGYDAWAAVWGGKEGRQLALRLQQPAASARERGGSAGIGGVHQGAVMPLVYTSFCYMEGQHPLLSLPADAMEFQPRAGCHLYGACITLA